MAPPKMSNYCFHTIFQSKKPSEKVRDMTNDESSFVKVGREMKGRKTCLGKSCHLK